jgi:hypothetical protein
MTLSTSHLDHRHGGRYRSSYDIRLQESKHAAREFPPGHRILESYLGGGVVF